MKTFSPDQLPPHYVKHSLKEMSWGSNTPESADLALSILMECVEQNLALKFYEDFKQEFVIEWDDDWDITEEEVKDWVNKKLEYK